MYIVRIKENNELLRLSYKSQKKERKLLLCGLDKDHFGCCGSIFLILGPEKGQFKLGYPIISMYLTLSFPHI